MSNGAQMVYRLACELSNEIAAIAPIASQGVFESCDPKRKVPVMHIHGKLDPCCLYEGGECGGCITEFFGKIGISVQYDDKWTCDSVPNYIDEWKTRNGCSDEKITTFQNKGAICQTYQGCQSNAEVTLCTIENLGHNWPGQESYALDACDSNSEGRICKAWETTVGPLSQDLIANDQIWEFFKKHSIK